MKLTVLMLLGLTLAADSRAFAQVSLKLDKDEYMEASRMDVAITVPTDQAVKKPRFHFIRDGDPLPETGSPHWIEFPSLTTGQTIQLRAPDLEDPEESGSWWLLLYDGSRMTARVPLDVVGWLLKLQLMRDRLLSESSAPDAGLTGPTTESARGLETSVSKHGYLQMESASPSMGESFTVIVVTPDSTLEDEAATLRWGDTAQLSWKDKETAPSLRGSDDTPVTLQAGAGPSSLTVSAPLRKPGRYDLRLFRGTRLLDVLEVTVQ